MDLRYLTVLLVLVVAPCKGAYALRVLGVYLLYDVEFFYEYPSQLGVCVCYRRFRFRVEPCVAARVIVVYNRFVDVNNKLRPPKDSNPVSFISAVPLSAAVL